MTKWDRDYIKLCKKILDEGMEVENRTGINTIKIPGYEFEFDLSSEFPVLTTKQLFFKNAITELLWIYQAQSNDVRWLQERGNHIWDEWKCDDKGDWHATQMLPNKDGKLEKMEVVKHFGKEEVITYVENGVEHVATVNPTGYQNVLIFTLVLYVIAFLACLILVKPAEKK